MQNPTAMLDTDTPGTYKVKLTVSDANPTTVQATAEIVVYADACQAKKDSPSGWAADLYDVDNNCVVDLSDLAAFALKWLDFTGMTKQETYNGGDIYALDADFYVEAENPYSLTDPNYIINAPLTPLPNPGTSAGGPHIGTNSVFSGGQFIGWTDPNDYIVYAVDVPTAGDYTVMLVNTFNSDPGTVRKAALGTVSPDGDPSNDDEYAYGEVTLTDGSGNYVTPKVDSTTVNFATAGQHLIRVTWKNAGFNLDLIAIKKVQ